MLHKRCGLLVLVVLLLFSAAFAEESGDGEQDTAIETVEESVMLDDDNNVIVEETTTETIDQTARNDFIDRIISLGHDLYVKANGKSQRAHYASDIYVCKNFTVYLFRQNRDDFRMAEYPDVKLVIPNNLPKAQCKPYSYGLAWEDIPASEGNPFYEAASFRYDTSLSHPSARKKTSSWPVILCGRHSGGITSKCLPSTNTAPAPTVPLCWGTMRKRMKSTGWTPTCGAARKTAFATVWCSTMK